MTDSFDAREYLGYLGRRWRVAAVACAVAGCAAAIASLAIPKRYTATATIFIDAPAGSDPRVSTAVSPIYLESLKTYEHFADSDTLFADAAARFHLKDDYASAALDELQRRVLKVVKPRDTKVLEISATLRDPVKAQALAQYVAEQTVELSRKTGRLSDEEFIRDAQAQLSAAQAALTRAEEAVKRDSALGAIEAARADVENLTDLESRLRGELIATKVDAAGFSASEDRRELGTAQAKAAVLEKQIAGVHEELKVKEKRLSERREESDALHSSLEAARVTYAAAERRLEEVRASSGIRSERLRIIDPGIVPQRPAFPHVGLNIAAALAIAAIMAWLYLTAAFHLRTAERRPAPVRAYRAADRAAER